MNHRNATYLAVLSNVLIAFATATTGSAIEPPKCVDSSLTIELVASEPQIVTPVSCRFDSKGRLYVIESHTHFPPEGYEGPKFDRIKLFDDPDGDGKLDRIRVFHEGTIKTMCLAIGRDESVYVATRAAIMRLRDTDGDDVADQTETLISLETKADYPHNGLSGLLLEESDGKPATLTFGMGENFGDTYVLKGSDGSKQIGGGEGGNIFKCSPDGSKLERIATGFWNPFGMCRDDAGRLLMVDNDADAMPPCRIVNVLPHADYGFQFRFGRAGTHPLQAWNGELPGTLPMVAGTGEAPCAILCYRGQYWVTSWGDNRIERYTPTHHGTSITAKRDVAVLGDSMFRPVDIAVAPDGSMYVTDWVDRSYNVHRKGRVWRLRFSTPATASADMMTGPMETTEPNYSNETLASLVALHWKTIAEPMDDTLIAKRTDAIRRSLQDENEQVRQYAVRWAAETSDKSLLPEVRAQLDRDSLSPQTVAMVSAALSYLETSKVEKGGFDALTRQWLVNIAIDKSKNQSLRQIALRLVPPNSPQWKIDELSLMVQDASIELSRDAARHLAVAASGNEAANRAVQGLINTANLDDSLKRDLAIGIQGQPIVLNKSDSRPQVDDLDAWMKLVGEGGDPDNGWRVFFSSTGGKCASCHAKGGRGAGVGPDLTSIAGNLDRRRILDSILNPSREIGPMYTTWKVLTKDGRAIAGLKLNGGGIGESNRYLLADSTTVDVAQAEIEMQESSDKSIMPEGLAQLLSLEDLRDLLAFLRSGH